jgi:hypothetical protein
MSSIASAEVKSPSPNSTASSSYSSYISVSDVDSCSVVGLDTGAAGPPTETITPSGASVGVKSGSSVGCSA